MISIEAALSQLVQALAAIAEIRAIGLAGGQRPLPEPGQSDLDLFVYCLRIPSPVERQAALQSLANIAESIQVNRLAGGHWGVADSLELAGVETWLMHFTLDEACTELQDLLNGKCPDRVDADYYPIGRCAMLQDIRVLYDPDHFLASLRAQVAEYPAKLAEANLTYHLAKLADTEDLDRAILRADVLFYHFALDLALDHLLQALFALNRVYFPSRKRSLEYIQSFQLKPAHCGERLVKIVELGGQAETLRESRAQFLELAGELQALAASTLT